MPCNDDDAAFAEINRLEKLVLQDDAVAAFLRAQKLQHMIRRTINRLEMLENRDEDEDAMIDWLYSFLPWAAED
jgi:hypothetical protein